ncbi:MAG: cobalamin-dependent protein [Deltaproteobacteria bacterium]|nr:cobalamin-dependent protein [Deltaproteobacteria bacterium]
MTDQSINGKMNTISKKQKDRLIKLIADLDENKSLTLLKKMHAQGFEPYALFQCCLEGVHQVGIRFEQGRYFISALIMAGEIMRQSSEFLNPYLIGSKTGDIIGTVLIGTIEGDIHDLGKNILKDLLQCNGFEVPDLGVDVPVQSFTEKALEIKPDFIAISCLLTTSLPFLRSAIELLHQSRSAHPYITIIGGCCIDHHVSTDIKADCWFPDAIKGANFCKTVALERLKPSRDERWCTL